MIANARYVPIQNAPPPAPNAAPSISERLGRCIVGCAGMMGQEDLLPTANVQPQPEPRRMSCAAFGCSLLCVTVGLVTAIWAAVHFSH